MKVNQQIRFFGEMSGTLNGDTSEIQIMRVGQWQHPQYGEVLS